LWSDFAYSIIIITIIIIVIIMWNRKEIFVFCATHINLGKAVPTKT